MSLVEIFADILEGIFIIIEQANEQENLEIKIYRKAFLLLMMITNIEHEQTKKKLNEFLKEHSKVK